MVSREIHSKDAVRALLRLGFFVLRKKGIHVRLGHSDGRRVTIAIHPKPLSVGNFHSILRQAKITKEEFDEAL